MAKNNAYNPQCEGCYARDVTKLVKCDAIHFADFKIRRGFTSDSTKGGDWVCDGADVWAHSNRSIGIREGDPVRESYVGSEKCAERRKLVKILIVKYIASQRDTLLRLEEELAQKPAWEGVK